MADDRVSSDEQLRIALELSQEDQEELDFQAAIAASVGDRSFNGDFDDSQLSNAETASLAAYYDELYRNRQSAGPAVQVAAPTATAQALEPNSFASIRAAQDREYDESVARDREIELLEEERRQRRAVEQAQNEEIVRGFESQYLNGDVLARFEYMGRTLVELRLNVNTPVELLVQYLSIKHHLNDVELFFTLKKLEEGTILSHYCSSGARIKIMVSGDIVAGGFNMRNSRRSKINIRSNSKRQNSKRQTNKRQTNRRQTSKRQISKRQNIKRMF